MIGGLDVDGRDIISQQNDFVRVDFVPVFMLKLLGLDEAGLQQAGDECSRPGERIEDMNALAPQRLAELGLQHLVHRMDDEIHHLNRGVDDAQALGHLREGVAEKLVVKLDDDLLLRVGLVDASRPAAHAIVEFA